ncbi:acyl carrier protein [Metabacillus arenae]|uniref:Acyl carrier protein n=1 Tax=Metabacillus arenae TaxID=2771434 RepID=A0A926S2E5_9BACI|nr:acyl carrier protein [Metabacillus arenae]MBD1381934.1 acyl carrier protein [Metabacillus arenae]
MILEKLQEIFRDILDDEKLVITEHTTRDDLEGWDSLGTVSIIAAVSEEFNIKIGINEIDMFKDVNSIVSLIKKKME